jgi:multicomponent Na+:H+ antiporter subunit D
LALNGAIAHAFASTLYQGLLFMVTGAVLYRTGTAKAHALGGLARQMPFTTLFAVIGGASIASVPLFSGFATKSLTLGAAAKAGHEWVWLILLFASLGALIHSGLRLSYYAFFAENKDMKAEEAPRNMLVAMAGAAALCLALGVYPQPLYRLLPYEVSYKLWDAGHVLGEMQLLAFAALAFALAVRRGFYTKPQNKTILNIDWFLRIAAKHLIVAIGRPLIAIWFTLLEKARKVVMRLLSLSEEASRESGLVSGIASTGAAAGVFLAVFALMLLIRLIT